MNSLIRHGLLAAVVTLSLQSSWAQSYREKEAAIKARVAFDTGIHIPELERAESISEIYTLIFQSGVNAQFHKSSGLVRSIVLQDLGYGRDLTPDAAALATRLRGNTLFYPTRFNASSLIAARLSEEAQVLKDLASVTKELHSKLPSLKIIAKEHLLWGSPNPNLSRLAFLENFSEILERRSDLVSAIKSHRRLEVFDSPERCGDNGFFRDFGAGNRKEAQLFVGRTGIYDEELFITAAGLEPMLEVGAKHGFTVRPSGLMNSAAFTTGLVALTEVLQDTSVLNRLRTKGVRGFEIDEDFARREELFQHGMLYVGTSVDDITQVIDLLFP